MEAKDWIGIQNIPELSHKVNKDDLLSFALLFFIYMMLTSLKKSIKSSI